MEAIGPPLRKDSVSDFGGLCDAVHEAVRLGKAVSGTQLLAGGDSAAVQRILQKLSFLLAHPLGHIANR